MKRMSGALALIFLLCHVGAAAASGIEGTVTFKGEPPPKKKLRMEGDAICMASQKGVVYGQTLVVGQGNTLGNVFLYIKNPPPGQYKAPDTPVVIDQKGCNYAPHVTAVMTGQSIKVLNPDGTLHNVHAISKVNRPVNLSMPKTRQEAILKFDKPEPMFPLKCDVHPWMGAWIAVMDHPFFAVTGEDGKFRIGNLPDGTYTLVAWQEKLGTQEAMVTVTGAAMQHTDFAFAAPGA